MESANPMDYSKWLPTSPFEMRQRGWNGIDILLVTGDAYVDHPSFGIAIIARVLESQGYRVAVVWQPDITDLDTCRDFGTPRVMIGVSAGNVDSMVANYTPSRKPRRKDDYTPPQREIVRPDRAVIAYAQWIHRIFPQTPIVIGGIEASLRRLAHYDWWQSKVRHSVLLDSKAQYLLYGMAEESVVQLAHSIASSKPMESIVQMRGLVYATSSTWYLPENPVHLDSFEAVSSSVEAYQRTFRVCYENQDPYHARPLVQKDGNRFVVHNPPVFPPDTSDLDKIYALPYTRQIHPSVNAYGGVKALETVRCSITTHRGCYGRCHFCAISLHQGAIISSRSESSILEEARTITQQPGFKGYIQDVGGPTANMYRLDCHKKGSHGSCADRHCLYPHPCERLFSTRGGHLPYIHLLKKLRALDGVKGVFIASGIRPDLIQADLRHGASFLDQLFDHHTGGQIKLAPEHVDEGVLDAMGKRSAQSFFWMMDKWQSRIKVTGKKQYIIGYFMCGHPGEDQKAHHALVRFVRQRLGYLPQQVQIFTPTPSTVSTTIYATGIHPLTGEPVYVEKRESVKNQWKREILSAREVLKDGMDAGYSKRKTSKGARHGKGGPAR